MAGVSGENRHFSAEQQRGRLRPPCMRTEAAMTSVSEGVVDGPVLALFADPVPMGDQGTSYYFLYLSHQDLSPLGPGRQLRDEAVSEIGRRLVTPADSLVF